MVLFDMEFEWGPREDRANEAKHGVSFTQSQEAFFDADRVIAKDTKHSTHLEQLFFCFGKVGSRVLTVHFTMRNGEKRGETEKIGYSVPVSGAKERNAMSKETQYGNAPKDVAEAIRTSEVVADFLPPPNELVRKEEQVKITINLSKRSIDFFKRAAAREGVPYQAMIKSLLDRYAERYGRTS